MADNPYEEFNDVKYISNLAADFRAYLGSSRCDLSALMPLLEKLDNDESAIFEAERALLLMVKGNGKLSSQLHIYATNDCLTCSLAYLIHIILVPPTTTRDETPPSDEANEVIIQSDDEPKEKENSDNDLKLDDEVVENKHPTVMSVEDLVKSQEEAASSIAEIYNISIDVARFLLQNFSWRSDEVHATFAENRNKILASLGIPPSAATRPLTLSEQKSPAECPICFETCQPSDLISPCCGHFACKKCWFAHIDHSVSIHAPRISCQEFGCNCPLSVENVKQLSDEAHAASYSESIADDRVTRNSNFLRCINPHCHMILTVDCVGLCNVAKCSCGTRICWKCHGEAHAPLACSKMALWAKITDNEALQAKWIVENTKQCPRCKTRIEKNGGCNHMTCKSCSYEFCWICGHEWHTHEGNGYECNKPAPKSSQDESIINDGIDLIRLNHYHLRFLNHSQARKLETNPERREHIKAQLISSFTKNKIEPTDEETATKIADEILLANEEARSVLVWSYPHAFFMKPKSPELALFEYVQRDVEMYNEFLVDLYENKLNSPPSAFRIPTKTLIKNTETLLRHVDRYSH